eukprot:6458667-Amphidinium_carterae.5
MVLWLPPLHTTQAGGEQSLVRTTPATLREGCVQGGVLNVWYHQPLRSLPYPIWILHLRVGAYDDLPHALDHYNPWWRLQDRLIIGKADSRSAATLGPSSDDSSVPSRMQLLPSTSSQYQYGAARAVSIARPCSAPRSWVLRLSALEY